MISHRLVSNFPNLRCNSDKMPIGYLHWWYSGTYILCTHWLLYYNDHSSFVWYAFLVFPFPSIGECNIKIADPVSDGDIFIISPVCVYTETERMRLLLWSLTHSTHDHYFWLLDDILGFLLFLLFIEIHKTYTDSGLMELLFMISAVRCVVVVVLRVYANPNPKYWGCMG